MLQIERYNALLVLVRRSCAELVKGIKGLVVMSADLDQVGPLLSCLGALCRFALSYKAAALLWACCVLSCGSASLHVVHTCCALPHFKHCALYCTGV